jgi:hypothetical protein
MRKDLRRRLAALAAAAAAAALLSGNIAGAQPAAQAAAGVPLSPEAIGATLTPGPNACPRLQGTSQGIPSTPNSCGPPPTTSPPDPTCDLGVTPPSIFYNPIDKKIYVSAIGRIACSRTVGISLTVELWKQLSPNAIRVNIRGYAGVGSSLSGSAYKVCEDGTYYGRVSATITWGVGQGRSYAWKKGGESLVRCS